MKYWLITTEFPPIHGGGISTYCWHTAKMLASKNHHVTIFINDDSVSGSIKKSPMENVDLIRFNPNQVKRGKALGFEARLSLEFAHIIESQIKIDGAPDFLETQDYLGIGYYILQKKKLLYPSFKNLRVVMTMHAPGFLYLDYNQVPHYKFPDYWSGEMEKATIRMSDLVLSPSNYLISELKSRMNLVEKKPIQIFNPFANEFTTSEVPEYEKGDLVFFGKLTPQKGCLEMLSYLKKMWDNGFDKPITIIGGGSHFFYPVQEDMIVYVKRIYSEYINKGLIKFEGNMPPNLLKERLKRAHIIITPSIVDNLPYAVLEAMSMGKIVLASEKGGHIEIIKHEKNGFIFQHEVLGDFEKQLNSILSLNESQLKEIGGNAQTTIDQLTNYETIYLQKIEVLNKLEQDMTSNHTFPFIETLEKIKLTNHIHETTILDKLSIVIPYFNMGDFIEDTLKSLQKISYSNTEIIVVNDGSTDQKSIDKINELEKKYDITVYHKENEGLSLTRNFGAEISNGEFLAFLDADDTVSPDYYKRAVEVLKHYSNLSFVGCWAQYFGESNDIWPTFNPEPPYLLLHNMINSSALIYKQKDFLSFGRNDPKLIYGMEDYDSVISMVKNGARGVSFPELWWQYRIRKNSMAQSFTKNKELYLYRIISKNHSSFFQSYGQQLVNLLNHNGPSINFDNPTWSSSEFEKSSSLLKNSSIITIVKKNKIIRHLAKKAYRLLNS